MIFLNIITFAVFGITWFSGSLTRVLGEYWSKNNLQKFNETLVLGKYIFTIYATLVSIIGIVLFYLLSNFGYFENIEISTILLISAYFILNYEALSERQAFFGANWQALGNLIELVKVIIFFIVVYFFFQITAI